MENLHRIADELGVSIRRGSLPHGWWGAYDHRVHGITVHDAARGIQLRSILAHELGHAYHRHAGSTPRFEREASHWAARHLISMGAFLDCLHWCDRKQGAAHHLGVLPSDVQHYIDSLSPAEVELIRRYVRQESA